MDSVKALDQIIRPSLATRFWRALGYRLAPLIQFPADPRVIDALTTKSTLNLSWREQLRLLVPGSRLEVMAVTRCAGLVLSIDSKCSRGVIPPGVE